MTFSYVYSLKKKYSHQPDIAGVEILGWGEHTLEKTQQQHIMLYCRIMFEMKRDVFPSITHLGL